MVVKSPVRGPTIAFPASLCVAAAVALATPACATPVVGTATIEYYLETPQGIGSGAPTFDVFNRLTTASAGYPILPHFGSGFTLVSTATSSNTFIPNVSNAPGFVSVAPAALGSPAVSGVSAYNPGPDVVSAVLVGPTFLQDNPAAPTVATVVVNSSQTTVQNTSGALNSGVALVFLGVQVGIAPTGNVQLGVMMSGHVDNPTLPDQDLTMPPIIVAMDGTFGSLPDVVVGRDQPIIFSLGNIGGYETYNIFVISYINTFTVENLGTLTYNVTFTGITDPARFSLIEFPQSLLDSMRPSDPALVTVLVAEIPEPASLLLLGAMLPLFFALARPAPRARRRAVKESRRAIV